MLNTVFLLALVFFACGSLRAQTANWDPPSGALPVGQSTALRLVFENCSPSEDPAPPKVDGLTLQHYGVSTNTSIVNGNVSLSRVYTFAAALTKNQRVEIPAFTVDTDKGPVRVPPARYEPTTATVGRSGTPLSDAATAKLTPTPASVWAGEVFDLQASISAARSYYPQFTRGFDWTPDPLLIESWSEPQQVDLTVGAEPHAGVIYRTRGLARSPGRFNLNAATHILNLSVGVSGFGFFQQRQYDQYSITSNTPTLEVKALPPAPAGFSGAVGQFKLNSKIVPEQAGIGEPITWTLELSGTGNWPDIAGLPSREVSSDFQVVQPKAKRTPAEGKVFDVTLTEDVVLVPTKAGSYALGPVAFNYFDPKSGTYKTLTAPRKTVTVTAPTTSPITLDLGQPVPATPNAETAAPAEPARRPPTKATPPAGIPRDPLPGSDPVLAPLRAGTLAGWVVAPFVAVLGFWFWLALRHAQQTDPLRPRREARARLANTLAKLRTAAPAERAPLLLAWQHDAAVLWQLSHAAPAAASLPDLQWSALWNEADRSLYGAQAELPGDWLARAEAALASKQIPAFRPLRLFLPRNLFPFAAALALAFALEPLARAAEDALAAYQRGDFSAAEKTWRDALRASPTDWIARHNLSLALEQQERLGESAGHASAAFVQNPGDAAVRWHFAHAAEKSGSIPAALAPFLAPGPTQSLARATSPAAWQRWIVVAALLAAAALGWILFNAYGRKAQKFYVAAAALLLASVALAGTATIGVLTYGEAANENAVMVIRAGTLHSIPTEADTTQKTTPLAAGALALTQKTFLGWTQLAFENGQTGWVRTEELVPLWRSPNARPETKD